MTELSVLNVGAGDTKLTFDPSKPEERKRAAAIVTDMLHRGFVILVEVGTKDGKPLYQRALSFDPATCEYLIAGMPETATAGPPKRQSRRAPMTRLAADKTPAVSVARSAGG